MLGLKQNASCRRTFVNFGILFLPFVYILDILLYVKQTGTFIARRKDALLVPNHCLHLFEKSFHYMGICMYA